jgi:hypothetical protein
MAVAFPIIMMAGAAISAMGAIQQANAAKASATYNATLKERDAAIANSQAQQEVQQVRLAGARAQGSLLADYGASGVTTEGSPMEVLAMSASQAKLDEENVLYRGKLKASGYASDAALYGVEGETALKEGGFKAASYLVGGAGSASFAGASTDFSRYGTSDAEANAAKYQLRGYH